MVLERVEGRTTRLRRSVRYGQKRLKRLSRTATLGGIFLSFLQIGFTGFGGGLAVIAQIRTLAVGKRKWFTERDFAEGFALAQSLPGTSAGNVVTYIGLRLRGVRGAALALAAFVLPSMLMMIVLAILYRHLRDLPDTERLFHGLNAAVVALIIVTAWRIGRSTLNKHWQWYVAVLSCLAVAIFSATIIEVVLAAGLVGIYIDSFAERRWQRWRRIRHLASLRRARLNELAPRGFVGGYLTRAVAEEQLRQQRIERGEAVTDASGLAGDGDALSSARKTLMPPSQRAEKVKGRMRMWRRALKQGAETRNGEDESGAENITVAADGEARDERHDDHKARGNSEENESDGASATATTTTTKTTTRLRSSLTMLALAMPVIAKLSLLLTLSAIFLRIGAVTFGGGFVMVPLIEAEIVNNHHWLTHQEFAEAFALGQITPGPVLITATFIGYRVAGTLGALVATVSIFLPSFVMTVAAGSSLRRFRSNRQVQSFLRGVTPAVVGLLVAAAWSVGRAGIHTWVGVSIAVAAALILLRFRVNALWVILGAGALRYLIGLVWA